MNQIRMLLPGVLLAATAAPAATLYEKDGIVREGTVRMAGRGAAVCQVLEQNESPEAYEQTKANHGRPLHVWRLDFRALNGSGRALEHLTAQIQIEAQWPPCTNWTGLSQYSGPVQWARSFETLQKASGLQPGEELTGMRFVLAIGGTEPRFANWQVDYRFGTAG